MLASITLEFWETVEKYLRYDASYPKFFCSTIQNQQQVNYSAIFTFFQALQKIRLTDETGQDVETSGNIMDKMYRRFSGTVSPPIYLYTLIVTDFID